MFWLTRNRFYGFLAGARNDKDKQGNPTDEPAPDTGLSAVAPNRQAGYNGGQ